MSVESSKNKSAVRLGRLGGKVNSPAQNKARAKNGASRPRYKRALELMCAAMGEFRSIEPAFFGPNWEDPDYWVRLAKEYKADGFDI